MVRSLDEVAVFTYIRAKLDRGFSTFSSLMIISMTFAIATPFDLFLFLHRVRSSDGAALPFYRCLDWILVVIVLFLLGDKAPFL